MKRDRHEDRQGDEETDTEMKRQTDSQPKKPDGQADEERQT